MRLQWSGPWNLKAHFQVIACSVIWFLPILTVNPTVGHSAVSIHNSSSIQTPIPDLNQGKLCSHSLAPVISWYNTPKEVFNITNRQNSLLNFAWGKRDEATAPAIEMDFRNLIYKQHMWVGVFFHAGTMANLCRDDNWEMSQSWSKRFGTLYWQSWHKNSNCTLLLEPVHGKLPAMGISVSLIKEKNKQPTKSNINILYWFYILLWTRSFSYPFSFLFFPSSQLIVVWLKMNQFLLITGIEGIIIYILKITSLIGR